MRLSLRALVTGCAVGLEDGSEFLLKYRGIVVCQDNAADQKKGKA
jgi:hypothetical protein